MKKTSSKVLLLFLFSIITFNGIVLFTSNTYYNLPNKEISLIYNEEPIYIDHMDEFDVINSNYIERFYERYIAYKKKNPKYSDDTIITYVNIGLDRPFYSNMESSNLSDGILILCNKYHSLGSNYVPKLSQIGERFGYGQLYPEATEHLIQMADAAKKENIYFRNNSSYRSYSLQTSLYNNYVNRDGRSLADTYSARAGTSEHQTGLAIDLHYESYNSKYSDAYSWLFENAYKFGFILRYPKDKTYITGYMYEPWHYRYVGEDVAKYIYENNITYEEYYATFILR